jgi:hypothetical protein
MIDAKLLKDRSFWIGLFYAENRKGPPKGGPFLLLFFPSNPDGRTTKSFNPF